MLRLRALLEARLFDWIDYTRTVLKLKIQEVKLVITPSAKVRGRVL